MKIKFYRMDWLGWAALAAAFLAVLLLTGCRTRKIDKGIYRVKSGRKFYVTDSPKEIKEIK